jgi:uncharacterized C2H2 Zn-finger protein
MPRKQTFQCPGCLKVFKDNYALSRHLNRRVPCTGRPTRVAQRLKEQPPRQKIRAHDIQQHFDEFQRTQREIEGEALTEAELTQLEEAFEKAGKDLRRAATKEGIDPMFNELIDLNTNMVSLLAEAERRGDQPMIDDIQELAQLFYEELMTQSPDANPEEVSVKALVAAQNVISEQLNAYKMGVYDPMFIKQQKQQPVDDSVYYDRLLRYYEIRTHLGMQEWQHRWALEVGTGAAVVSGTLLHLGIIRPFTTLANWFQTITPFVPWDRVHIPFLGHTPLGGLLSWASQKFSAAGNVLMGGVGSLLQYLSGVTLMAEITAALIIGILSFTIAHLYLRIIHTRKVKVNLPVVNLEFEN